MTRRESTWLTLGQASDLLGVHPTTLRAWVANGELHAFRTPGGHRRFQVSDLREFIAIRGSITSPAANPEQALRLVRERLDSGVMQGQTWYSAMPDTNRSYHREMGRRLLGLLLTYVSTNSLVENSLSPVQRAGRTYGSSFRKTNLAVSDVARAFVLFKRTIFESTIIALSPSLLPRHKNDEIHTRINSFMDELLIAILSGYDTAATVEPRRVTPAGTKSVLHHTKSDPRSATRSVEPPQ